MANKIGITKSDIQEKCNVEFNCPRHALHVGIRKEDEKLINSKRSENILNIIALLQE